MGGPGLYRPKDEGKKGMKGRMDERNKGKEWMKAGRKEWKKGWREESMKGWRQQAKNGWRDRGKNGWRKGWGKGRQEGETGPEVIAEEAGKSNIASDNSKRPKLDPIFVKKNMFAPSSAFPKTAFWPSSWPSSILSYISHEIMWRLVKPHDV